MPGEDNPHKRKPSRLPGRRNAEKVAILREAKPPQLACPIEQLRVACPPPAVFLSRQDIDDKGAIVVWPTEDTDGTPPPGIKERFPDIVPEVPRAFERRFQGLLPLIRIGWAVIRPREAVTVEP